jgi:hypothetical protein
MEYMTESVFIIQCIFFKIQMAKRSVRLKHSVVLRGMFKFKPESQFVERYHNVVSCALNMAELIIGKFCKFSK